MSELTDRFRYDRRMRKVVGGVVGVARSFCTSFHLTWIGLAVLLVALSGLAGSLIVFGGVTEDVTQHNGLSRSDPAHLHFFIAHRSVLVDHIASTVTYAGMVAVALVVASLAAMAFWYRGLRVILAIAPVVSLAVASLGVAIAKNIVGRSRPPISLRLVSESDASFPSGHAANSAAVFLTIGFVAAVFLLRRPTARAVSVLIAAAATGIVGISRLVLGVHWPSDVLGGWALGMSVALTVTIALALIARLAPRRPRPSDQLIGRLATRTSDLLTSRRPTRSLWS